MKTKKSKIYVIIATLLALPVIIILFATIQNFTTKAIFTEDYKSPDCNVILISIDTLRADHLGCYGYGKNTTPNIDEFSKDSVLFKETIAQASSTLPSHASIFTSLIPSHHGAFFSMKTPIPQEIVTMAEILKVNNYNTISYNGGGQIAAEFGLNQGFDLYDSWPSENITNETFIKKVNSAINWIKNNSGEKFFLFLHTYETHHPYTPKKEYLDLFEKDYSGDLSIRTGVGLLRKINKGKIKINKKDKEHIINTYDAEIYSMDKAFGVLVDFLKKESLYDNAIIIFTSDHGEEFGEHGMMGWHSHTLYDEQLKVPLIVKFPDSKYTPRIIGEQTKSIDILPTLLDILDIPASETFEGVSLISRLKRKKNKEIFAVSQQDTVGQIHPTTIRTKKWKLYDSRLFNLELDPLEKIDVAKEHKSIKKYLRKNINEILQQRKIIYTGEELEPDKETSEGLKALGYVN